MTSYFWLAFLATPPLQSPSVFKILNDKLSDNTRYLLLICDCIHFLFNLIFFGLSGV